MSWSHVRSAVPYSNWQIAKFVLVDVGFMFTPLAMFSGVRKASYIRQLLTAAKKAPAGSRGAAAVAKAEEMKVRTFFSLYGVYAGAAVYGPGYSLRYVTSTGEDVVIGYYMDRLGKLQSYLPAFPDQGPRAYSTVLPAAGKAPRNPFAGLGNLKPMSLRGHLPQPTLGGSRTTTRINPDVRSRPKGQRALKPTRSPLCPVHKRRHWCTVTRAKFK